MLRVPLAPVNGAMEAEVAVERSSAGQRGPPACVITAGRWLRSPPSAAAPATGTAPLAGSPQGDVAEVAAERSAGDGDCSACVIHRRRRS